MPPRQLQRRFEEVPLNCIDVDPKQVRSCNNVRTQRFTEMCANVTEYGVLQPVLVRTGDRPGRYTLVAGEFRYEAARKAGLTTLPCYIEEETLDQTDFFLRQLSENLHRRDLSHVDLARAFDYLTLSRQQGGGGLKAKELARRLSKSEAFISEHRMLLALRPKDLEKMEAGVLSFDQARAKLRKQAGARRERSTDPSPPAEGSTETAADHRAAETTASAGKEVEIPRRLDNRLHVYATHSGYYPGTGLMVLVAGLNRSSPTLDAGIRVVEHHLHYLKLKQIRTGPRS